MTRAHQIAAAIESVDGFEEMTTAELQLAILGQVGRPNSRKWTRDDLVEQFGEATVVAGTHALGPFFATYLVSGIDMSEPARRARFEVGGDLRARIGDELAELLLALGFTWSSRWSEAGGSGDDPTEAEIDDVVASIINQRLNRQQLADRYNAAAALVESNPAATWAEVAEFLGE